MSCFCLLSKAIGHTCVYLFLSSLFKPNNLFGIDLHQSHTVLMVVDLY